MTIKQIFLKHSKKLSPLDLEIILSYVLKKPKEFLYSHDEYKIPAKKLSAIVSLIGRRLNNEPVAYLTGKKEFFGLEFEVNRNVLIPRPETELLVEAVLNKLQDEKRNNHSTTILDVGTGSGNIIISILKNIPRETRKSTKFVAIDVSRKALAVAKKNAEKHMVLNRIRFVKSDLLDKIINNKKIFQKREIILIANLPYLTISEYKDCSAEIKKYEPSIAFVSPSKGLSYHKKLLGQAQKIIKRNGCREFSIYTEINPWQKQYLSAFLQKHLKVSKAIFQKDLTGRLRMAVIKLQ